MVTLMPSGCMTVGPDYRVPPAAVINEPAAQASFVSAMPAISSSEEPPGAWWRLFHDPTLDGLVTEALGNNTDLRVASANIARADAAVREAKAARAPVTSIGASPAYALLSAEQYLAAGPLPSFWDYDVGISVAYQVDLFGQIRRGIEAASADSEVARAARDVTRVTVAADTAQAYAGVCSAGHALAVAEHSLEVQRESASIVERLYHAGRGIPLDVTRATAQVAQLSANIPTFQAEQRVALYRLAVLTGRPPGQFPQGVEQCNTEPQLTSVIPVGNGASLLRRRPDVREAERALAAATARIGVATADLYPKIQLGLTAGSTGLAKHFMHRDTQRYSIGPLVSWEFPNQDTTRARIGIAEASTQAALARFDGVVLAALRDLESTLTVYARDLDRDAALQLSRDKAAQAESDARRLYEGGRIDYFPVLDAERTLAASEQVLAASEGKIASDRIAIFLALGGGWEEAR
jgi:NodT family efflux transporter outer membrane factor (OMF) lipoprotein